MTSLSKDYSYNLPLVIYVDDNYSPFTGIIDVLHELTEDPANTAAIGLSAEILKQEERLLSFINGEREPMEVYLALTKRMDEIEMKARYIGYVQGLTFKLTVRQPYPIYWEDIVPPEFPHPDVSDSLEALSPLVDDPAYVIAEQIHTMTLDETQRIYAACYRLGFKHGEHIQAMTSLENA